MNLPVGTVSGKIFPVIFATLVARRVEKILRELYSVRCFAGRSGFLPLEEVDHQYWSPLQVPGTWYQKNWVRSVYNLKLP